MKHIILLTCFLLLLPVLVDASEMKQLTDTLVFVDCVYDSSFITARTPDSVRIIVFKNGAELSDAWYNDADAQCDAINGELRWKEKIDNIDNGAGDYLVEARFFYDDDSLYNPFKQETFYLYAVRDTLNVIAANTDLDNFPTAEASAETIYNEFIDGSNEDPFKATGFATPTDVNDVPAETYAYFISGTNEDQFKATGFATSTALANLSLKVDTVFIFAGWRIGCSSISGFSANIDTLRLKYGATSLIKTLYYHVGGEAADPPDSTSTIAP